MILLIMGVILYFYPRPPRGGRQILQYNASDGSLFLPTPSARRATKRFPDDAEILLISTHALREEGDYSYSESQHAATISTHALREEGDTCPFLDDFSNGISTHALREEGDPDHFRRWIRRYPISTHALREEGDP